MEIKSFKNKKYFKLARSAAGYVGNIYIIFGGAGILFQAFILFISITSPGIAKHYLITPKFFFTLALALAMGLVLRAASRLFEVLANLIEEAEKTI